MAAVVSDQQVRGEVFRMLKQLGADVKEPKPEPVPKAEMAAANAAAKARKARAAGAPGKARQGKAKPGSVMGAAPGKKRRRGSAREQLEKTAAAGGKAGGGQAGAPRGGPWFAHPAAQPMAEGALPPPSRKKARKRGKAAAAAAAAAEAEAGEAEVPELSPAEALKERVAKRVEGMSSKRHKAAGRGGSDESFVRSVLSSGTLSDKVAAMTLMVQESPLLNLRTLDSLMSMARKKGRREASMALEALRDLFVSDLLPARPLRRWDEQPLHLAEGHEAEPEWSDRLAHWYLESELKARYAEFVDIVSRITHDTMQYMKKGSVTVLYDLLCAKPENERALLALLVNKLGDPDRKVASKVVFLLSQLLLARNHPGMKGPVVTEVERLLFRPNVGDRAQYYAVIFLNQMMLQRGETELASRLIGIYFAAFKRLIALGGGVMAPEMTDKQKRQAELKARRKRKRAMQRSGARRGRADGAVQAVADKLKQSAEANEGLQSKMLSALLTGVNRAYPYAAGNEALYEEHADVIFRLVHKGSFVAAVQGLMLLYQVMASSRTSSDRFYRALYSKLFAKELTMASFSPAKRAQFLNLVFRAMKHDTAADRVCAFARRLLQLCQHQSAPFVCGVLYLVSEVSRRQPALRNMLSEPEAPTAAVAAAAPKDGSDDEEEDDEEAGAKQKKNKAEESTGYDPLKREPLYARALGSCLWEIETLCRHFHPSVAMFAQTLRAGDGFIKYKGDPLKDFTNQAFLDRFVYRNPKNLSDKERAQLRGSVVLQNIRQSRASTAVPVNSDAFLKMPEHSVPVDERFFHRFFLEKARREGGAKTPRSEASEEAMDEFADSLIEAELRKMAGGVGVDMDDADGIDYDYSDDGEEFGEEEAAGSASDDDDDEEEADGHDASLFGAFKGESDDDDEAGGAAEDDDFASSDDDDEASAMAEAFGGDDDSDDDDDDDSDSDVDSDEEEAALSLGLGGGKGGKKGGARKRAAKASKSGSMFADADEFASLLEGAGKSTTNKKQEKWESRNDWSGSKRRRGGGGGGGGKGKRHRK